MSTRDPLRQLSRPTPRVVHRLAGAALVANIVIVVTGGGVRLTGSGLGCPTFPQCSRGSYRAHRALGVHGAIEFGNRMLTFVLTAVVVALLVAALRARPRRRDVRRLAWALFLGIPAQALLGGITVLTKLNPWLVMLHFMLSMVLIALAAVLVRRTAEGDAPPRPVVAALLQRLTQGVLATVAVTLYLGTVVTGSGPHSGDEHSHRTGLDPDRLSQLHADIVFLLVGLTVALVVALAAAHAPAAPQRAARLLLTVELAQGAIGFVQYVTGLPAGVVALHMLGASVLVAVAVRAVLAMRVRDPLEPLAQEPAAAATAAGQSLRATTSS